ASARLCSTSIDSGWWRSALARWPSSSAWIRSPWHPEQAISLPDALAAAARGRRGIRAGDPADLVITAGEPAAADPAALRGVEVLGTLLGGRWTYRQHL
ncbi:hypothetical protein AB0M50_38705, partial [Nonomuraea fuscirosea]